MPWTLNDYPSSLKNLDDITKKKAIDIANAMVDEGYPEDRAIPIATSQAKEWRENASQDEVHNYKKQGNPAERDKDRDNDENNPERLEEGEQVVAHEDGWAVQSSGAQKPSNIYDNKNDAISRAREIAKNKGTGLILFNQDGSVQDKFSYKNR